MEVVVCLVALTWLATQALGGEWIWWWPFSLVALILLRLLWVGSAPRTPPRT